jgi:hypothetical protein
MKLNRKLNLVFDIEREDGTKLYIHAMPISREVFETFFLVISKAFAAIYSEGLQVLAGPRVAALVLKQVATDAGQWDGPTGVRTGLMNEIRRLANVVMLTDQGWATLPLQSAIDRDLLDEDELAEAEGVITFFICASAMHRRSELGQILTSMTGLWGAQLTSLNCTEFATSLPTSTATASSTPLMQASSVPS